MPDRGETTTIDREGDPLGGFLRSRVISSPWIVQMRAVPSPLAAATN